MYKTLLWFGVSHRHGSILAFTCFDISLFIRGAPLIPAILRDSSDVRSERIIQVSVRPTEEDEP